MIFLYLLTGSLALAMLAVVLIRDWTLLRDSGRLVVKLARDPAIPRPLRWLLLFALMPIPGPGEEIAGGIALIVLLRVRPGLVRRTWAEVRS